MFDLSGKVAISDGPDRAASAERRRRRSRLKARTSS